MNEASFWKYVREGMKLYWICERIENAVHPGIPDLFYAAKYSGNFGFIELKYLPSFPKQEETLIKIPHFRPEQKLWFRKWGPFVNIWMFIRVENEFFLFDYMSALHCETWDRKTWEVQASGRWINKIAWKELREIL